MLFGCAASTGSRVLSSIYVARSLVSYQDKITIAFGGGGGAIDINYVDGISLTYGASPRNHIWTFAAALNGYNNSRLSVCPCTDTRTSPPPVVPSYVGDDYFCDTGSENNLQSIFYGDDPLWDGAGCGEYNTCCEFNSPPWFRKEISPPISDDIEMRLCATGNRFQGDMNFETLEIYVQ